MGLAKGANLNDSIKRSTNETQRTSVLISEGTIVDVVDSLRNWAYMIVLVIETSK